MRRLPRLPGVPLAAVLLAVLSVEPCGRSSRAAEGPWPAAVNGFVEPEATVAGDALKIGRRTYRFDGQKVVMNTE